MNRRHFIQAAAATAGLVASNTRAAPVARRLVKPRVLRPGALVGLVAPGGVVNDDILAICVRNLESFGLRVKLGANIRAVHGGYAGTVQQRLDDLHGMFVDREIAAIWTARGGSGCTQLLPHIRYDLVRRNPKILVGYSDITALHVALHRLCGLVTFHGPVAWSSFSDYSVAQLRAVLMEPQPRTTFHPAVENQVRAATRPEYGAQVFRPGVATGPLVGGNLSVVAALAGTPYAADTRGALLYLEEVGEPPYRVDRMLTQLDQAHPFKSAAGLLLGVFSKCEAAPGDASLTLRETLQGQLGALPVPAVYGYSFGHIAQQFTLPFGLMARLDTAAETLTLLEPAVTEG